MKVAVLGASPKADRYSNKAIRKLKEHGHDVIPVNPAHSEIEGLPAAGDLAAIEPGTIHTVSVYVGAARSSSLGPAFLALHPKRVIFNPGAENLILQQSLTESGVEVVEGCTLVMLSTGTFDRPDPNE